MAITLFAKPKFEGASLLVNHDFGDLRNTTVGNDSSSAKLSQGGDRAVFFGKPIWRGQVLFRRGVRNIPHLGDRDVGGKPGFNNDVQSVRVTPFTVRLHFHVIRASNGRLPGTLADDAAAKKYAADITA